MPRCGDFVIDTGEACDHGPANSDTEPDTCRAICASPTCGDKVTDTGEECDGIDDSACHPRLSHSDCTCPEPGIPAVSHWGLVAMAVLLLLFSKRYFGRRTEA